MPVNLNGRAHTVEVYANPSRFFSKLGSLVATHLHKGNAVCLLVTPEHRAAIESALEAKQIALDVLLARGRYVALDAKDVLRLIMQDGSPNRERFKSFVAPRIAQLQGACSNMHRGKVFVYGELVQVLVAEGKCDQALELERYWNELANLQSFDLYCGYSSESLLPHTPEFEAVCFEHSRVVCHP